MTNISNSHMPPREKMLTDGVDSLNTTELISILIDRGPNGKSAVTVADELLTFAGNNLQNLGQMHPVGMTLIPGIGLARATVLSAAMELGRRRSASERTYVRRISTSKHVFDIFTDRLSDLNHEEFWILLLKRSNDVLVELKISSGGLSGTVADPKIIFGKALALRASAMVLIHNHPSGNNTPSQSDITLTDNLKEAGKFLDLPILDHIIVAGNRYYSFADSGRL
jgi:DNA repair protein RadC